VKWRELKEIFKLADTRSVSDDAVKVIPTTDGEEVHVPFNLIMLLSKGRPGLYSELVQYPPLSNKLAAVLKVRDLNEHSIFERQKDEAKLDMEKRLLQHAKTRLGRLMSNDTLDLKLRGRLQKALSRDTLMKVAKTLRPRNVPYHSNVKVGNVRLRRTKHRQT